MEIIRLNSKNHLKTYCSKCKKEYYFNVIFIDKGNRRWQYCRLCGKVLIFKNKEFKKEAKKKKPKLLVISKRTCHYCKNLFTPKANMKDKQKFCSPECKGRYFYYKKKGKK